MKVDVSEIKSFKACKRQWKLSSRNNFHLRPRINPPQFAFGTMFHESLASLYLGASIEKVLDIVNKEMSDDTKIVLFAMLKGYNKEVLPEDLKRFKVLDIEHHFEIAPTNSNGDYLFPMEPDIDPDTGEQRYDNAGNPLQKPSLLICGSIDMICLDVEENKIYGFEHKTCKNFRDPSYLWLDEQPRVYTWALQQYVNKYNEKRYNAFAKDWDDWDKHSQDPDCEPKEPEPATLGGVYLNEVKKLMRQFQYQRTLCTYTEEDLDNFMQVFFNTCTQCKHMVDNNDYAAPQPSYFACQMCSFKSICTTYKYANVKKEDVLKDFNDDFVERKEDHLEEKTERSNDDAISRS